MTRPLRIATRRSQLALWQARHVADLLKQAHPGLEIELVAMTTQGDRVLDRPLAEAGGKGLFVKELERAIADGHADIAVHSMKDVPSELPPGMTIAAVLPRANPHDAFVSLKFRRLEELPAGGRVGTSSPRRQAQLRPRDPISPSSCCAGTSTRVSSVSRTARSMRSCSPAPGSNGSALPAGSPRCSMPEWFVPAVGQGVIGIECATMDAASQAALAALHDPSTGIRLAAERAYAQRLQGSCHSPIAAHASLEGKVLRLSAFIGAPDGREAWRDHISGPAAQAADLGVALADRMLGAGAAGLLERLRQAATVTP